MAVVVNPGLDQSVGQSHYTVRILTWGTELIRTSINFFSNLSNSSSSVGSDHTGQPSLPTCINEPRPPMTLSPVLPDLYLGNFKDARDREQLARNNITHILSIHDTASPILQ
ncbi:hypothetical protein QTP86_011221, partial [Hemibagrus guttatus]